MSEQESASEVPSSDAVAKAVADTYLRAGIVPGGMGPVAPLRRLVAGLGLIIDEIPHLNRATAARHLADRAGRGLVGGAVDETPLAGFLYANAAGGWVLVNRGDPLVRRRFSIAHEAGHYRLHFLPLLDSANEAGVVEFHEELTVAPDARSAGSEEDGTVTFGDLCGQQPIGADVLTKMEVEADQFAAELLLPGQVIRGLATEHESRSGGRRVVLARWLAATCLVSHSAMRRRLEDLGLGAPGQGGEAA